MTIDAAVLIGEGPDSLEGTKVTTPAGADLFREGVVISDPDNAQGRANVKTLGVQLSTADSGLVVNAIIHGETTGAGGGYRDVKVNPSGALVTDATGSTVALDAASLAALENVNATVSGTVAVSSVPFSQADTNVTGTWGYLAGTSGTVTVPAGGKVLQISATSLLGGSFTVNGGQAITIPANQQFTLEPRGNLVAATVVFTSTTSYVIEYVS